MTEFCVFLRSIEEENPEAFKEASAQMRQKKDLIMGKDYVKRESYVPDQNDQDQEAEEVKWNPTPEVFSSFLERDAKLSKFNLRILLQGSKYPMTLKDIKGCMLHAPETVESTVALSLKEGLVRESQGKYSL